MAIVKTITGMIGTLLFGGVFTVIGIAVTFFVGKPILDNAKASQDWPSVAGAIVSSEVVTKRGDDGTMYAADVVYAYNVDNRDYKCSTVAFGGDYSSSSSSHAYDVTNTYPVGSEVRVFYDPQHPSTAVLEPGTTWMSYLAVGIGLVFLAVGLAVCVVPLFYLLVGGVAVGAVATGMGGRAGNKSLARDHLDSAAGASGSEAERQRTPSTVHDGIEIK